ncbi:MAG: alpha/beta hydrolase [Nitrospinae bacterium]|nr:alpha/beta hydrolase [Nitrospinota bacterium]
MYAEVNHCKVYYERAGAGAPLLLLHGWGASSQTFRPLLLRLAEKRTVVALDFPGFGLSPVPPSAWGTEEYAEMVKSFLQKIGLGPVDVMAHSFGARVAILLAKKYPDAVKSLVLTGAAGVRIKRSVPLYKRVVSKIGRVAGYFGPPGGWIKQKLYAKIASADYLNAGKMRPILVKVVNEDLTGVLPFVSQPTLLAWGADDRETTLEAGRIMNAGIKNSSMKVIEGAGHYPFLDKPDQFYAAIKEFLGME